MVWQKLAQSKKTITGTKKVRREISFRAWDKVNKRMIPLCFIDNMTEEIELPDRSRIAFKYVEYMEFTSFRDKAGNQIHEEDIVKTPNTIWKVLFRGGAFIVESIEKNGVKSFKSLPLVAFDEVCKIIGNVHENPELLKGLGL